MTRSVTVNDPRAYTAVCDSDRPQGTRRESPSATLQASHVAGHLHASRSVALPYASLSTDDLRRNAPSVFAENARPGVSSRYTFVSTAQVVDLLRGEGWEPVLARQQRVRLPDRQGFQMHEIRFTEPTRVTYALSHPGNHLNPFFLDAERLLLVGNVVAEVISAEPSVGTS